MNWLAGKGHISPMSLSTAGGIRWRLGGWVATLTLLLVLTVAWTTGLDLGLGWQLKAVNTHPAPFCGKWSVVGTQGEQRGTVSLLPDGQVLMDDGYTGRWRFRDTTLQIEVWPESPRNFLQHLAPNSDLFLFRPDNQRLEDQRLEDPPLEEQLLGGQTTRLTRLSGQHVKLVRPSSEFEP